jgi:arylformamidase
MTWIDLSLPLHAETVHWPGHPRYSVTDLMSIAAGDEMNVSALSMCSHFGTHIDAPRHYYADGPSVDELPLELLAGPCRIVSYQGSGHIPPEYVDGLALEGVRRLLIRTRNSETLARPEFDERYLALTPAATERLVAMGVELLGLDGYSIGPFEPELGMPVHRIFLAAGPARVAVEEVDLSQVEAGDYDLVVAPLRLVGLEGAPARVFVRAR